MAPKPWRVLASKRHINDETRAYLQRLGTYELVQAGNSLKFCRIAEGSTDIYPRPVPTYEWDTAAAQAVRKPPALACYSSAAHLCATARLMF